MAIGASASTVDPKIHRKWVWAFIDAVANLVDVVVINHSVRMARFIMFFVITPCDSADAPKRSQCWQALGNSI